MTDAKQPEKQTEQKVSINVLAQYVKDLSFENPNIVKMLSTQQENPDINVNVQVHAQPAGAEVGEGVFEVTLTVEAKAKQKEEVVFLVELIYGGLFSLPGANEELLKPFLLIECPRLLFPFARQIVADVTRDGGMPPLLLSPVDFAELYHQQAAQSKEVAH